MAELELRHLRAVCAIADEGSVTRAAARLGVTQPALSAQLRSVERLAGGTLFDRTTAGSTPTEFGRAFVRAARVVLDDMNVLFSSLGDCPARGADAPLVVASMPMIFTGPLITELGVWFVGAEVRAEIDTSAVALLDLLVAKQADIAVFEWFEGMRNRSLAGIEVRTLLDEPEFVAISAASPLAAADEVDLADLADRDWVVPPLEQDGMRLRLREACQAAGFTPRIAHHVTEARLAMALTAAGAVCLAQPASIADGPGWTIRPLRGDPLRVPILVAMRSDGPLAARWPEVFACMAHAYRSVVDRNESYARWWREHPDAHAELDAALATPRPAPPRQ
jgi:DNA-binding transcriptional LysR family regulator